MAHKSMHVEDCNLDQYLEVAEQKGASDLHVRAGQVPHLRVAGLLQPLGTHPCDASRLHAVLYGLLQDADRKKWDQNIEIDTSYTALGHIRTRVHIYAQKSGMGAAFRLIPEQIPTLAHFSLPPIFQTLSTHKQGLFCITGPTGSGKSSSLAAFVNHINATQAKHIVTIEDPIEFVHCNQKSMITQREVGQHTRGFQDALKATLRQDPDVIVITELRDIETIRLALTAAETGHLVVATLHTSGAVGALGRIIDVFPGSEKAMIRLLLAESLLAIVSQRLHGKSTGAQKASFEILINTPAVRNLIRANKHAQIYSVMQTSRAVGMCVFEESAGLTGF